MGRKILIVDDNDEFRQIVRKHLETQGKDLDIFEAKSGEVAIAESLTKKPDVVLMDIRLPLMNGIDAARRIKEEVPQTHIIIVTMFESEEFKRRKDNGIFAFVGKSEIYDRLLPTIERCLKERTKHHVSSRA